MAQDWQVVAQRQTTDLAPDGRFVDVVEVTFTTQSGTAGTVRVAEQDYTPDRVRELIQARVDVINAVHQL